jgi:hypothetical protein
VAARHHLATLPNGLGIMARERPRRGGEPEEPTCEPFHVYCTSAETHTSLERHTMHRSYSQLWI